MTRPNDGTGSGGLAGRSGFDAPSFATTSPLAALLTAAGVGGSQPLPEVGFHQGTVLAWDSQAGTNTIEVLGAPIEDVPVLTTGDNILMTVGNQVGVLRFRSQYFVLGRITAPGASNAFAWSYDSFATTGDVTAVFPNWGDLTSGTEPTITFEVGTSRKALVFMSLDVSLGTTSLVDIGLEVIGTSSYGPTPEITVYNNSATDTFFYPVTSFIMLTDNPGSGNLDPGITTIKYKYRLSAVSDTADVSMRKLLVIPI